MSKGKVEAILLFLYLWSPQKRLRTVTNLKEGIDSSSRVDQENWGSILNRPQNQLESSSSRRKKPNTWNLLDDLVDGDEDQMLQEKFGTKVMTAPLIF